MALFVKALRTNSFEKKDYSLQPTCFNKLFVDVCALVMALVLSPVTVIDSLSTSDKNAVLVELKNWASAGGLLPLAIRTATCDPLASLLTYLSKLTDSVSKLTLSGDNTKVITDAKTSTNTLLKQVGCKE